MKYNDRAVDRPRLRYGRPLPGEMLLLARTYATAANRDRRIDQDAAVVKLEAALMNQ